MWLVIKRGMRTNNLIGIEDIGVKIESAIQLITIY